MPEGPDILSYVYLFRRKFLNARLKDIKTFENNKEVILCNSNCVVTDINCKGKLLWFELDNINYVHIHLKITGHYSLIKPSKHLKYELIFDNENTLYIEDIRGLLSLKIMDTEKHIEEINKLGTSIFDNDFTLDKFKEIINKKKTMLCSFLFNQKLICGIGNYIINESLYLSKLNFETKINTLSEENIKILYKNLLIVAFSSLMTNLKEYDIALKTNKFSNIPNSKYLIVPYNFKIYSRKELDDGTIIKNKKICGRKMYYI